MYRDHHILKDLYCLFTFESNILKISHFKTMLLIETLYNYFFCLFNVESLISSLQRETNLLWRNEFNEKCSEILNIFLNFQNKKWTIFWPLILKFPENLRVVESVSEKMFSWKWYRLPKTNCNIFSWRLSSILPRFIVIFSNVDKILKYYF